MRALRRPQQRLDLASQRRVVHFHLNGSDNPDISGHLFAADNLDDVSADQLFCRDLGEFAVTHALGGGGEHVFETLHEGFGLRLLQKSDDPRDEDDDDQHEGEIEVGQVAFGLNDVGDDAEDGADPQQDGEPVGDFLEEADPTWRFLLFGELVVSFLLVPPLCAFSGHARFDVSPEPREQLLQRDFVFVHALDLVRFAIHLPFLQCLLIFRQLYR